MKKAIIKQKKKTIEMAILIRKLKASLASLILSYLEIELKNLKKLIPYLQIYSKKSEIKQYSYNLLCIKQQKGYLK